jgi:hypothetical protein
VEAEGKGAGLIMPRYRTAAMQAHLIEISAMVAPNAPAFLILDQAGWHLSSKLVTPTNLTLLPPLSRAEPSRERLAVALGDTWLSNRASTAMTTSSPTAARPGTSSWTSLADQILEANTRIFRV